MGDRVVGLCNFCEVHGPRVVFVCQDTSGVNGHGRIGSKQFYSDFSLDLLGPCSGDGDEDETVSAASSSDTCDACRSSGSSKPAYLTNDHEARISYLGCQYPYRVDVFSRVRCACVRSLSCEACPGRQGPIVFGDSVNGYCLCYVFTLKDSKARGFQHSYSIVVVSREIDELLRNYSLLVASLKMVVTSLQSWADRVFDREGAESIDRMPQIAASGRAGWVPSGFFLRSSGGGGPCRVMAAPRSLSELTDRADVFRSLHRMFVDIHRVAATAQIYTMPGSNCSQRLGKNGDFVSFESDDGGEITTIDENGDYCHTCAACITDIAVCSSANAFRTLTILYDVLGSEAFSMLVYHLLIGNQIVVRSSCICSNRVLLAALKLLLPSGCVKCVDLSTDYREPWECNLVGLLVDQDPFDSYQNGESRRGFYSRLPSKEFPQSLSDSTGDGCVILSVEFNPGNLRNGNIDYFGRVITPSILKDRSMGLQRDGYHFRVCCTAAASTNSCLDTEAPALLQSLLTLLSTAFSKYYSSESGAAAGRAVLEALKNEWLRKAKLYYVMAKMNQGNDDAWRRTFFRIAKCSDIDEPILKFWRSGLSRQFKQGVLCHYALQLHDQHPNGTDTRMKNGM